MRALLLLLLPLVLTACSPSPGPAATPTPTESRPRVDSALCDDLRAVVAGREGTPAPDDVTAAARRVLVELGPTPAVPEELVSALRELEGGAGRDDALDATVAAFVAAECGGA